MPQHLAIDFISGNSFVFAGDTAVLEHSLYNFHLKPARVALQLDHQPEQVPGLIVKNKFFSNGIERINSRATVVNPDGAATVLRHWSEPTRTDVICVLRTVTVGFKSVSVIPVQSGPGEKPHKPFLVLQNSVNTIV